MKLFTLTRPVYFRALAGIGILFGFLTLREGGAVLFGDDAARTAAGDYVAFVVWFNFLAGFVYIIAGAGLAFRQPWAVRLAFLIASATLIVFVAFEMHTVDAMTVRSAVWLAIATIGWRILRKNQSSLRRDRRRS